MTRRSFLQTAMHTILTMGCGSLFSSRSAAASESIRHLRQIITAHPARTRMIQWDSLHLLKHCRVELRQNQSGHIESFIPAYHYFAMDGEAAFIYHVEIPFCEGAAYRVIHTTGATTWIPLIRMENTVRALLFSDSQCGESYEVWHTTYQTAWQRHPSADFAAIVGDLTDNGESSWHWRSFFEAMDTENSPLASHIHVPVLGNHEYYGLSWTTVPPIRYLRTFELPMNGSRDFQGHYYSFDIGPVHCIVLDTQFLELGERGASLKREQMDFLLRDASATSAPWRIVLMHKDILSYGDYQDEQKTNHGISDVGQVFLDVFDQLGIDLVISGHIHAYRRRRIRARQTDERGTLYLLAGPAGNQYFDVPRETYDIITGPNPTPSNYLYMEADSQRLHIRCEAVNAAVLDAIDLYK